MLLPFWKFIIEQPKMVAMSLKFRESIEPANSLSTTPLAPQWLIWIW